MVRRVAISSSGCCDCRAGSLRGCRTLDADTKMRCPGLRALVNAKDLSKDVTTLKVREDSKLQEVLQEVKEAGIQLREQVLKNLNLMPEQDRIKRALKSLS